MPCGGSGGRPSHPAGERERAEPITQKAKAKGKRASKQAVTAITSNAGHERRWLKCYRHALRGVWGAAKPPSGRAREGRARLAKSKGKRQKAKAKAKSKKNKQPQASL